MYALASALSLTPAEIYQQLDGVFALALRKWLELALNLASTFLFEAPWSFICLIFKEFQRKWFLNLCQLYNFIHIIPIYTTASFKN